MGDPIIGQTIGGVQVSEFVGEGGMGRVYAGMLGDPPRKVAVKFLSRGFDNPEAVGRFRREAEILDRLRHPGIAEIVGHGLWDDGSGGIPYMVIEFVEQARTLADFASEKRLDQRGRLELFHRACEAVAFAHQMKILHRDLKPANLLVDRFGRVKVIDFGVARGANGDLGIAGVRTETGQLIGTVQYMSPEQIAGDPRAVDLRSDVYALGVILYEILVDAHPYDVRGLPLHEAARVVSEAPIEAPRSIDPSIDASLDRIVMRCLDRDRTNRFDDAGAVAAALARYLAGPGAPVALRGSAAHLPAVPHPDGGDEALESGLPVDEVIDLDAPPSGRRGPGERSAGRSGQSKSRGAARGRADRCDGATTIVAGGGSGRGGWFWITGLAIVVIAGGLVATGIIDMKQVVRAMPGLLGGSGTPASASAAPPGPIIGETTSTESLAIVSAPEGALVTIDGKAHGRTPLSLMITWTPDTPRKLVEITAPGFEGAAAIVMPDPAGRRAEPLRLVFNLAPRGEGATAPIDRLLALAIEGGPIEVRMAGAPPRRLEPGRREILLRFEAQPSGWQPQRVTLVAPGRRIDALGRSAMESLEFELGFAEIGDQPMTVRITPR